MFVEEKTAIAKYAASLIDDGDLVYIDAGTATEKMIYHIQSKNVTFVTNGFMNAKLLAQRGFKVYIPGGEIKSSTEAIVKGTVIHQSKDVYILADHSKFDRVTSVRFEGLNSGVIITDRLPDKKYLSKASIKEVL
ncbi:MAG: hypothetical protein ACI4JN_09465 [Ruminococcus sp.]